MEAIKIARFALFVLWIALGGYVLYATASHPGLVIGITAAAALGPYLRPWPLGAALTWAGACLMALLYTGDGGFLELGVFGTPVVLAVGCIANMVPWKRT
ncbi:MULTISPECIES: hypothetical protein [unclassified Acidovorax]|uniref:hypothetical protein n=1 Tax=unclassified Acidovorax TaxID=2684926 RepID=UPI000B3F77DA|nr:MULTISPECIES: hypothetical protein [unclassified Acidovorax]